MSREASSELSAHEALDEVNQAPTAVSKSNESSQPVHNVLNTCQTDSESIPPESVKSAGGIEQPEAPKPVETMHSTSASASEHPLSASVAASEPAGLEAAPVKPDGLDGAPESTNGAPEASPSAKPVAEQPKPADSAIDTVAQDPKTGEKRELEVTETPSVEKQASALVEPTVEQGKEHDSKKQKTEHAPSSATNGTSAATDSVEAQEVPKESSPSKKEKVKEAVKKILPTDGPGTRTRSRTKDS
ncbi:hypothetical protein POX_b03122 [Penicillium oxalicum]|uniref:hypothetical protein n=1 Tax=Penicillium oxalicum TaxID=69781 RepID=UPI0020B72421|nr:hypothetical protein POX_b03122 [Penicillium oxalicum]KAI2793075.1 hypothetical protein POX_b03122 [Penicillium oxalicum]